MSLPKIYAGKRRRLLWLLVANGIAQAICGVTLAYLLRAALASSQQQSSLAWLVTTIASLGVLMLTLRIREARDAERLGQNYVTRVRLRIFDRLAARPTRHTSGGRWGVTMTRMISDLNSLRNWVSTGIARAIVASISAVGLLAGLAFLSPLLSLSAVGMIAVFGLVALGITPRLRTAIRESRRRRGRLANNLGEKILALPTIRQLGRRSQERARVRSHSVRLSNALVRRVAIGSALRSLPDLTMPIAVAGVALAASRGPEVARESVVAVLLLGMIAASLRDLARAWDHRLAFDEGHRRIAEILRGTRIRESKNAVDLDTTGPLSVEFLHVSVAGALDDVSYCVEAGEHILLTGPSGSGKTTLLALAARMFDPDLGEIQIGRENLRSVRLESLHASVQLVTPDLPLLRGTVAENVGYGLVDSDPDWIDQVMEACGLNRASEQLAEGLATRVEEQGRNLPDGVRARVALARAMALAPRVLLVDDLTFSTDPLAASALSAVRQLAPLSCISIGIETADVAHFDRAWTLTPSQENAACAPDVHTRETVPECA